MFAPQAPTETRGVRFTAPCPQCGVNTDWHQRFASSVDASDFTITCTCTERGQH